MKGRLLANVPNKDMEETLPLMLHTLSISEIFQILLAIKNHKNSTFPSFPN